MSFEERQQLPRLLAESITVEDDRVRIEPLPTLVLRLARRFYLA